MVVPSSKTLQTISFNDSRGVCGAVGKSDGRGQHCYIVSIVIQ